MTHPCPTRRSSDLSDVNAEILFASPEFLSAIWSPRPHLGVDINTAGDTSQLYLGLTWRWQPFEFPLWGAFSTGGSVHTGETGKSTSDKELGSRVDRKSTRLNSSH